MSSAIALSARAIIVILPRFVESLTCSPGCTPRRSIVLGFKEQFASGSTASSTLARRVIEPVCQCSSWRPVVKTIGKLASGTSSGGITLAGAKRALPPPLGNPFPKTIDCPGSSNDKDG